MPTLLAETIMQTVVSVLDTALAATVMRGRVDPIPAASLPAVGVFQGPEERLEEGAWPFIDAVLEVRTEVAAQASTEAALEGALNEQRRLVHQVMMTPNALSLAYVVDIIPVGVDEPVTDGEGERIKGSMVVRWGVHYRHTYTDAGVAP